MARKLVIIAVFTVLFTVMAVMFVTGSAEGAGVYADVGIVCAMDGRTDEVFIVTPDGNVWTIYGIEDWCVGDVVGIVFDDVGTELIFDDEIINVRYLGWVDISTL